MLNMPPTPPQICATHFADHRLYFGMLNNVMLKLKKFLKNWGGKAQNK